MLSRYHRNSVMHGCINYFCLACEAMLRTEKDVNTHIASSVHKMNLDQTNYVKSCLEDRIRKVNKGYYCDYCNVLLTNMIKINLHIKEPNHKLNKRNESKGEIEKNLFIKWVKNAVIAFDDLLINEDAWNGVIDNICIICGDEFEDEEIHKNETEHCLKLIQAKVQVKHEKNIYRKIDESTYQCLTCNTAISPKDMVNHFNKTEHTKLYTQCRKAKQAFNSSIGAKLTTVKVKQSDKDNTSLMDTARNATETEVTNVEAKQNKASIVTNGVATEKETEFYVKQSNNTPLIDTARNAAETEVTNVETKQNEASIFTNIVATLKEVEISKKEINREKIIDSISDFQKNGVRIDLMTDKAFCTKCSNNIDFVASIIEEHIEGHKKSGTKFSGENYPVIDKNHNKTDVKRPKEAKNAETADANESKPSDKDTASDNKKDAATFAKRNKITYNSNHSFAFCRSCKKKIPSSIKSMEEHVNGNAHQGKSKVRCGEPKKTTQERPDTRPPVYARTPLYRTKPMEDFITTLTHVRTMLDYDTVINDKICISVLSFALMTRIEESVVRCQVCEQSLLTSEINDHSRTSRHNMALRRTPVLYTLESEFVREVRPAIYHCGFCNLIDAGYDCLQHHLRSTDHATNKSDAECCLKRFLPGIRISRFNQSFFRRAFWGGFPF